MKPKNRQFVYLNRRQMQLVFNETMSVHDMNVMFGLSYCGNINKDSFQFIITNVKQYMLAKIKYGI